ncbi:hypothetical protein STEG23_018140 [Scotinomys teguina]
MEKIWNHSFIRKVLRYGTPSRTPSLLLVERDEGRGCFKEIRWSCPLFPLGPLSSGPGADILGDFTADGLDQLTLCSQSPGFGTPAAPVQAISAPLSAAMCSAAYGSSVRLIMGPILINLLAYYDPSYQSSPFTVTLESAILVLTETSCFWRIKHNEEDEGDLSNNCEFSLLLSPDPIDDDYYSSIVDFRFRLFMLSQISWM